jgi:hypothetical protein
MREGERLVGRDAALAVLRAALQGTARGRGELVLLAGEAGIGKTALAAELARQADAAGALVLWGQCWQGEAVPAYWPWVQVLRAAAEADPEAALGDAGRLLSGGDGAPAGRGEEPAAARFRLFDAVVRVLAGLAGRQPLVLVLDDLHWADEASLRLLRFAARHLAPSPVLLLGTYRDLEAPARLQQVAGAGQVVPLAGLAPAEVAALMAAVTGDRPPEALAADVWRRTGGNPFFVRELSRLLAAQPPGGGLPAAPAVLDSIRDTLERRLARLSQPCAEVLAVAAVAGPQVGLEVLARVLPDRGSDLPDLLGEAVRARVLTAPEQPLGPYRFAHDLFRETVYGGLPAAQRAALHLAVGRALEALRAEGAGVHAAELAAHFLAAASSGATAEAAQAVRWSAVAAGEATARLAFEDARDHAERALLALDLVERPDPATRLELLLDLAEARARAGDGPGARATHLEAAALARRLGHGASLARAAVGVHALGAPTGSARDQQIGLLAEAAEALAGQRTPLRARVLACLARELHHSWEEGNLARAPAVAEEAVALARQLGDPAALAFCLLALHDARWRPGGAAERLPVVEEMLALAAAAGDRELLAQARLLRAVALVELGDVAGRTELEEYCRLAEELGNAGARWGALSRRAAAAMLAGRLRDARALAEQAGELGERIGEPDAESVSGAQLWELGRFDARRSAVGGNPRPASPDWPAWRAIQLAEAGDLDAARAALDGFDPDRYALRPGVVRSHDPWPLLMTAEAVALAGDRRQRAAAYAQLRPLAGGHTVLGGFVAYTGAVDHYLGLLAEALGRPDDAAAHLRAAVEQHERLGATAWAGLSRERLRRLTAPPANVFRRDGQVWTLTYQGTSAHLPDSKGLRDLAALLAAPGEQVHAVRLLGGRPPIGGADPVLDEQARAAYRARLAELEAEVDQADTDHDPHRADRARAEREALLQELSRAVGLGGRARRLGDEGERARKAVSARIRDAIARVERAHPALGRHLRQAVTTGTFCSYTPDTPTRWRL